MNMMLKKAIVFLLLVVTEVTPVSTNFANDYSEGASHIRTKSKTSPIDLIIPGMFVGFEMDLGGSYGHVTTVNGDDIYVKELDTNQTWIVDIENILNNDEDILLSALDFIIKKGMILNFQQRTTLLIGQVVNVTNDEVNLIEVLRNVPMMVHKMNIWNNNPDLLDVSKLTDTTDEDSDHYVCQFPTDAKIRVPRATSNNPKKPSTRKALKHKLQSGNELDYEPSPGKRIKGTVFGAPDDDYVYLAFPTNRIGSKSKKIAVTDLVDLNPTKFETVDTTSDDLPACPSSLNLANVKHTSTEQSTDITEMKAIANSPLCDGSSASSKVTPAALVKVPRVRFCTEDHSLYKGTVKTINGNQVTMKYNKNEVITIPLSKIVWIFPELTLHSNRIPFDPVQPFPTGIFEEDSKIAGLYSKVTIKPDRTFYSPNEITDGNYLFDWQLFFGIRRIIDEVDTEKKIGFMHMNFRDLADSADNLLTDHYHFHRNNERILFVGASYDSPHFTMVEYLPNQRLMNYYNSLQPPNVDDMKDIIEKAYVYINFFYGHALTANNVVDVGIPEEYIQSDGYNCGPYILQMASDLIRGGKLNPDSNFDVQNVRQNLKHQLEAVTKIYKDTWEPTVHDFLFSTAGPNDLEVSMDGSYEMCENQEVNRDVESDNDDAREEDVPDKTTSLKASTDPETLKRDAKWFDEKMNLCTGNPSDTASHYSYGFLLDGKFKYIGESQDYVRRYIWHAFRPHNVGIKWLMQNFQATMKTAKLYHSAPTKAEQFEHLTIYYQDSLYDVDLTVPTDPPLPTNIHGGKRQCALSVFDDPQKTVNGLQYYLNQGKKNAADQYTVAEAINYDATTPNVKGYKMPGTSLDSMDDNVPIIQPSSDENKLLEGFKYLKAQLEICAGKYKSDIHDVHYTYGLLLNNEYRYFGESYDYLKRFTQHWSSKNNYGIFLLFKNYGNEMRTVKIYETSRPQCLQLERLFILYRKSLLGVQLFVPADADIPTNIDGGHPQCDMSIFSDAQKTVDGLQYLLNKAKDSTQYSIGEARKALHDQLQPWTPKAKETVKSFYFKNRYPSYKEYRDLSKETGLPVRQIQWWFCNARRNENFGEFPPEKRRVLEKYFTNNPTPSADEKTRLAEEVKLSITQIEQWFINRNLREGRGELTPEKTQALRKYFDDNPNVVPKDFNPLAAKYGLSYQQLYKQYDYWRKSQGAAPLTPKIKEGLTKEFEAYEANEQQIGKKELEYLAEKYNVAPSQVKGQYDYWRKSKGAAPLTPEIKEGLKIDFDAYEANEQQIGKKELEYLAAKYNVAPSQVQGQCDYWKRSKGAAPLTPEIKEGLKIDFDAYEANEQQIGKKELEYLAAKYNVAPSQVQGQYDYWKKTRGTNKGMGKLTPSIKASLKPILGCKGTVIQKDYDDLAKRFNVPSEKIKEFWETTKKQKPW